MQQLPRDILYLLTTYLPVTSVLRLSRCCKSLSLLRHDERVWLHLLRRDFADCRIFHSRSSSRRYSELCAHLRVVDESALVGDYRPETQEVVRRLLRRVILATDSLRGVHDLETLIGRLEESELGLLYDAAYHYDQNRHSRPHDNTLEEVHRQIRRGEKDNIQIVQKLIRALEMSLTFSALRLLLRIVVLAADEVDLVVRAQASFGKPTGVGVRGIYPALVILGIV